MIWKAQTLELAVPLADSMKGIEEQDHEEDESNDEIHKEVQKVDDILDGILDDIKELSKHNIVDEDVNKRAENDLLSKKKMEPYNELGIPLYKDKCTSPGPLMPRSIFVEVDVQNNQPILIRKQTAVWLFLECERVSTDRLFRVRALHAMDETQDKDKEYQYLLYMHPTHQNIRKIFRQYNVRVIFNKSWISMPVCFVTNLEH